MKIKTILNFIIGAGLLVYAGFHFFSGYYLWAVIKLIIGASLIILSFTNNRAGMIIFGHMAIVAGAILITAGIYYVPLISKQIMAGDGGIKLGYIFGMPLFWGFISLFGGICAIYHGFCQCIRKHNK